VGSGSVAAAARVEPSPEGLAQADTAVRVDPLDTNSIVRRLSASMGYILPIARERVVSPAQARPRPTVAIKTATIAS
jgi:hypothetical protein